MTIEDCKHVALGDKVPTTIRIGDVVIGGGFAVIAGPCAVESETMMLDIAEAVKDGGADMLRGGIFKPRTSPYDFQGLGNEGLQILKKARKTTGLPIVVEILDTRDVAIAEDIDVIQIGSRNMQNFALLKEVGKTRKPILLKRGANATIEEWLCSAEYILAEGNPNVILCERGIRTFETYTRNTLDLGAVAAVKTLTHLPVIVDPSHATGRPELILPMALAAAAAGADGIIVEVHNNPAEALCDGKQALTPQQFSKIAKDVRRLHTYLTTKPLL